MSPFKTGDVVTLKSGGPKMTVTSLINESIFCGYFDKNTEWQTLQVRADLIAPYEEKDCTQVAGANHFFAHQILFQDPFTFEELCPMGAPTTRKDGTMTLKVQSRDGKSKWKHTILTEEI